jgi:Tropinone reductase 1
VEELAEFGAAVHICARNEDDIQKCLEEWKSKGFNVTGSVCDVLYHDQREKLMEMVDSILNGKLNILVRSLIYTI